MSGVRLHPPSQGSQLWKYLVNQAEALGYPTKFAPIESPWVLYQVRTKAKLIPARRRWSE
jgi:hypothetical protein